MHRIFFATMSALAFCIGTAAPAAAEKPNIVLILVDDLGWQDVKCYDIDEPSPMETPNIDALRGVFLRYECAAGSKEPS